MVTKADREMAATICAILASQSVWHEFIESVAYELEASDAARDLAESAWLAHRYRWGNHRCDYGECESLIRTGWVPS